MKLIPFLLLLIAFSSSANNATTNHYSYEELSKYSRVAENEWDFWQLTKEEWDRYLFLMEKSPWSKWEQTASPLQILSIYATSTSEKRRYASLEAELDQWRQNSVVEFQTLYDLERPIIHAKYLAYLENRQVTLDNVMPHDKLRLFISINHCDARCRTVMSRVMATQAQLDIYLVDANNKPDEAIFQWAESANIPVDRVQFKQITLNRENGILPVISKQAGIPMPDLPILFRMNGELAVRVPL